jgi:hypothetical protein
MSSFPCWIGSGERSPPALISSWLSLLRHSLERIVTTQDGPVKIAFPKLLVMERNDMIRIQKPVVVVCVPFQNSGFNKFLVEVCLYLFLYHTDTEEGETNV